MLLRPLKSVFCHRVLNHNINYARGGRRKTGLNPMKCFGFEGWILVVIASVPDLCILFTLITNRSKAIVLLWFSLFGFSMLSSPYVWSITVPEWPPFGK